MKQSENFRNEDRGSHSLPNSERKKYLNNKRYPLTEKYDALPNSIIKKLKKRQEVIQNYKITRRKVIAK